MAIFSIGVFQMSSSNLAVRMEHTATDLLSHPPRPLLRDAANDDTVTVRSIRPRTSLQHRNIVIRDQGLRFFRLR
jgi:hypothetical protein